MRAGGLKGPGPRPAALRRRWPLAALALLLGLSAAAPAPAAPDELESLRRPARAALAEGGGDAPAPLRGQAMMEAAMGAAVQAGARRRYQEIIAEAVLPNAAVLDEMFDFEPLVSRNGDLVVVPPVASGAGAATRIESEASASSQAASFRLARPARLASAVPHWRHYLLELPDGPAETHPSLLPEGAAELGRWRRWVDRGWALGVERAEALFQENVAKLARDYAGMMLFRRLAAGSLASGPVAAETEAGAEAGGSELVLGKKLYRLTETGRFLAPGPPRPPGPGQAEGPP